MAAGSRTKSQVSTLSKVPTDPELLFRHGQRLCCWTAMIDFKGRFSGAVNTCPSGRQCVEGSGPENEDNGCCELDGSELYL